MTTTNGAPVLCYGLKWSGLDVGRPPLCPTTAGPPDVEVRQVVSTKPPGRDTEESAETPVIALVTGGQLALDRREGTAIFHVPAPICPEALVHPYLVPAAAVFCSWAGWEAYHAGAFVVEGGAWAVVGDKEGGKSTTLAALAQLGFAVLSDDLLVLDNRTVLPGPRLVDLREASAIYMGLGHTGRAQSVESAREGGRWRVRLAPAPAAELAGWVFLRWGNAVDVREIGLAERVRRVIRLGPTRPEAVVSLASMPAYDFVRPRSFAALPGAVERLLLDLPGSSARR